MLMTRSCTAQVGQGALLLWLLLNTDKTKVLWVASTWQQYQLPRELLIVDGQKVAQFVQLGTWASSSIPTSLCGRTWLKRPRIVSPTSAGSTVVAGHDDSAVVRRACSEST
jgi:hypothetical protein